MPSDGATCSSAKTVNPVIDEDVITVTRLPLNEAPLIVTPVSRVSEAAIYLSVPVIVIPGVL